MARVSLYLLFPLLFFLTTHSANSRTLDLVEIPPNSLYYSSHSRRVYPTPISAYSHTQLLYFPLWRMTRSLASSFPINKFADSHELALIVDRQFVRLHKFATAIICNNPLRFIRPTSFATTFHFSIPPDGRLFFNLHKSDRREWFGIELDSLSNKVTVTIKGSEGSVHHSSVALSPGLLVLNSGKKLRAWIDYDASAGTVEVRLSESGKRRPDDPVLRSEFDFVGDGSVRLGISDASNHQQPANIYSWTYMSRQVNSWFHYLWMIFGLFVAGVAVTKGMKLGFSVMKATSFRSMILSLFVAGVAVATGMKLAFTITKDLLASFAYIISTHLYW